MLYKLSSLILLFVLSINTHGQTWLWGSRGGSNLTDEMNDVAADPNGYSYAVGYTNSQWTNYGILGYINQHSPLNEIILARYKPTGETVWVRGAGGADYDIGRSVATDPSGNAYITGSFRGDSIKFGAITLTNSGSGDMFLAKYDTAGNVLWAVKGGGALYDEGMSVTTDTAGNVYVTGYFRSLTATFNGTTITNGGQNTYMDGFVTKYSPSGNLVWARRFGNSTDEMPQGIATDKTGNVYVTGYYESPVFKFASDSFYNYGSPDVFVLKYDPTGTPLWARRAGYNGTEKANDVTVDNYGNPVVTGFFQSPEIIFGTDTLKGPGTNMFVVKYSPAGNIIWARKNTSGGGVGYGVACTFDNQILVTGSYFANGIGFDFLTLQPEPGYNIFIAWLDSTGAFDFGGYAGGAGSEEPRGIAADKYGSVWIAGYFNSPSLFLGTTGSVTNSGDKDALVARYEIAPAPQPFNVVLYKTEPGCIDTANGIATATASGGKPPYTILWSTGDTTSQITGLSSGTYSVSVWDDAGTNKVETFTIDLPGLFSAASTVSATEVCPGDTIFATYTYAGGQAPFNVTWHYNGSVYQNIDTLWITGPDTIQFSILDSNWCLVADELQIQGCPLQMEELNAANESVTVYPNPSSGELRITSTGSIQKIDLYSTDGQLLISSQNDRAAVSSINRLPAGIYIIEVALQDSRVRKRWVKQ